MFEDEAQGTAFRDVLMLILNGTAAAVVLLAPWVAMQSQKTTEDAATTQPGSVIVEARWGDDVNADVDLWVRGPDGQAVGYSNKGGALFNLLRDDLGRFGDATEMNYETSVSRGIMPGKYTVNLHLYRNMSKLAKLPVKVVVSSKPNADESTRQLLATTTDLLVEGDELTAFNFHLDAQGNVTPGSVDTLQTDIRALKRK